MIAEHHSKPEAAIRKRCYSAGSLIVMFELREGLRFHAASFTLAAYLQLIAICKWSDADFGRQAYLRRDWVRQSFCN
jgi:hypothetical protein